MSDTLSSQIRFEVGPKGWKNVRLEDVCERPQYGYTASAIEQPVGPHFLRITDITEEGVNWASVPYCKISDDEKYALKDGDILVARIGATTGKSFLITKAPRAIFASYLIRIRVKHSLIPEFLNLYMQSQMYWQYIQLTKGGRLKQGVNIPVLNELPVPLPPVSEQKEITRVLSTIRKSQQAAREVIEAAEEIRRTLVVSLRQNELLEGFAIGGLRKNAQLPPDWKFCRLSEIADTQSGGTPRRDHPEFFTGNIPWLKSGELDDQEIFQSDEQINQEALENSNAKILPKNTLLVALYGATVGKTGMLRIPAATNQAICSVTPKNYQFSPDFLRYYLISRRDDLLQQRYGAAQPNISQQILRNLEIILPPLHEQQRIATRLKTLDKKIATEEQRMVLLQNLYHTLLHDLFNGRIRLSQRGS